MAEEIKPDIETTLGCLNAGKAVVAASTNLTAESRQIMVDAFDRVETLLTAASGGDTTAAALSRMNGEVEADFGMIMAVLNNAREQAGVADLAARATKAKVDANHKLLEATAGGDFVTLTKLIRESVEPTATQVGIHVPGEMGNILNKVDVAATKALGRIFDALQKMEPSVIQAFKMGKDNKFARDFFVILEGGVPAVKDRHTELAMEAAKIFKEETRSLVERANAAGHKITFNEIWSPRDYLPKKIQEFGTADAFAEFLAPKLAMSPTEATAAAKAMFANSGDMKGAFALAARKLEFKSPQDALDVFDALSGRTISEVIQGNVRKLADTAVWSEAWGPMGKDGFYKYVEQVKENIPDTIAQKIKNKEYAKEGKVNGFFERTKNPAQLLDETLSQAKFHAGRLEQGEVTKWVTSSGAVRNFIAAGLLKGVALYTFTSDIPKGILRSYQLSSGGIQGMADGFKYMTDVLGAVLNPGKYQESLAHLDTMQAGMLAAQANDALSVDLGHGGNKFAVMHNLSTKAARMTYKFNMIDRMSNASYIGMQMSTMRTLQRAGRTLDDVGNYSPELYNSLRKAGISDDIWAQIADPSNVKNGMIDASTIADPKVKTALAAWQRSESYNSISRPDNYTAWMFETLGGSVESAGTRATIKLLSQFMGPQFAVGRSFIRALNSNGFYGAAGKLGYAGVAIPAMIAGGMVHAQVTRFLKGQPMFEPDDPLLWMEGLDRSGLIFLAGGVFATWQRNARTSRGAFLEATDIHSRALAPIWALGGQTIGGGVSLALGHGANLFGNNVSKTDLDKAGHTLFRGLSMVVPKNIFVSTAAHRVWGGSLVDLVENEMYRGTMRRRKRYSKKLVKY
jgi:hypothetical protein